MFIFVYCQRPDLAGEEILPDIGFYSSVCDSQAPQVVREIL
jgi:hypothetical protein